MGMVKEEGLLGLIMLLISAGVVFLLECGKVSPIPWENVLFSLLLIGIGVGLAFIRGSLKIDHSSG